MCHVLAGDDRLSQVPPHGRTTRFFQSKRESEGIAAGRGPPRGGVTAAQFTSIGFNLVRDGLDFRHLVEPGEEVLGQLAFWRRRLSCRRRGQREADDSAVARQRGPRKRCLVSMRGNDSKNESRLKSYGRFLNRFIPPQCRKAVLRSFLRRLGIQFAARQFVPGRGESDEHPPFNLQFKQIETTLAHPGNWPPAIRNDRSLS